MLNKAFVVWLLLFQHVLSPYTINAALQGGGNENYTSPPCSAALRLDSLVIS
jgi:hypothetical protein